MMMMMMTTMMMIIIIIIIIIIIRQQRRHRGKSWARISEDHRKQENVTQCQENNTGDILKSENR
jgi:uncharacterized membrane protein